MERIKINRDVEEIDKFVIEFVEILQKVTEYTIVSGYVAILAGRNRTTDDIDILIPSLEIEKMQRLHNQLIESGYWCLNTDNFEEVFSMLKDRISVRYAKKPYVSPNIELKFIKNKWDELTFQGRLAVEFGAHKLQIGPLDLQIAYKEAILKSDKDIEDARHIRLRLGEYINEKNIVFLKKRLLDDA